MLTATVTVLLWCVAAGGSWIEHFREPGPTADQAAMLVDVNHADAATLRLLPGIGPKLAERIMAQRVSRPFARPDELMRVSGIGGILFQRIRPMVECR